MTMKANGCRVFYKLGITSNNVAKLWAIRHGLHMAQELGFRFICLEIDSTLVIHLLTLQSNPIVGMSMVAFYCKNLLGRQWNVKLQHIYHEANRVAYLLAKRGKTKWKE